MTILRRAAILAMATVALGAGLTGSAAAQNAPDADQLTVLFELSYSKQLATFVRSVSDPTSKRYRRYRTVDQLVKAFGPKPKAKAQTRTWAARHGLRATIDPSGAFATVTGDPAAVRAALAPSGAAAASATPAVPRALRGIVASATFAQDRPSFRRHAATDPSVNQSAAPRTGSPAGCTAGQNAVRFPGLPGWTPNQYLTAYGHDALHARGLQGQGVRMAVIEIDGFNPSDVAAFAQCFGITPPPIKTVPVAMDQPLAPGPETTLDLEVLIAAAPALQSITVYENDDPLLSIAAAIANAKTRPDVISISLGDCENDIASNLVTVRVLDTLFALAAGSGTSTLASTADSGSTSCLNADGEVLPVLTPSYPATSPYVTAVGGTNISLDAANQLTGEWVWNGSPQDTGAGTGGQSLLFPSPWWQNTGLPTPNRTVPDISALADNHPGYAIYCTNPGCATFVPNPPWGAVGGTSAATPLMAAGVALANQAARAHGQPTLGLLNPLIYRIAQSKNRAQVLSDVTVGTNDVGTAIQPPISAGQPIGCCSATPGYDLASGWGSMNIPRFNDVALGYGRATTGSARSAALG